MSRGSTVVELTATTYSSKRDASALPPATQLELVTRSGNLPSTRELNARARSAPICKRGGAFRSAPVHRQSDARRDGRPERRELFPRIGLQGVHSNGETVTAVGHLRQRSDELIESFP